MLLSTALGVGIGLMLALALSTVAGDLLHGVNPRDPAVYAAGTVLLLAVTLVATWLPARRASQVDPQAALRAESRSFAAPFEPRSSRRPRRSRRRQPLNHRGFETQKPLRRFGNAPHAAALRLAGPRSGPTCGAFVVFFVFFVFFVNFVVHRRRLFWSRYEAV